jgi:hypothetical protein
MSSTQMPVWLKGMAGAQKHAAFNLAVIAAALLTVLALTPLLGFQRAHGALGILGLMGLGPFLFRKRQGEVFYDERDVVIQSRAWVIAYSAFWVIFVAVCVLAPFTFGADGYVRVELVQLSVWYGFMIVWGLSALVTLIQYARGGSDAAA